ncbi:conserved hypothetical protein [Leishmania major strain Friedlin]|uniref:Uncharacterized protein n=1 Tax=Leishmania major TaxID=5664 RepID=Q4Q909_LEIMA|nr:conserved hypothetical protein [Leishmania major strain Friedlin]CAG9576508.1 hypothetical_protein_-_conserved [Leishmania major strain Friedlin]CAJ05445.1 conserved hypothetical protein [Leishmania major strain Friedlin]|eukprot:XP_001684189.1 conserved hypothetical protein [Leishmania major strain Friedlin]
MTDIFSSLLGDPVRDVVTEGDGECGNTRQSATAGVACSPCPAPSLPRHCSAAPPSPSSPLPSPPLHVVVNHGGDLSEHPSSASSSHCFKVLLARQQPPLPPPPLPSSSHSPPTVHAEVLVEALEAKAAGQRRRGHTLGWCSRHHREWRRRHKRHRLCENPGDSSRGTNAMTESSGEEAADTYAKVQQQQRRRQRMEKQAGWESRPSSSIDDSSDSYLHRRDRVTQCKEQQRRPPSRLRVAEQSVDCIAVQLPLQRAKEAPASASMHTTVISSPNTTSHPGAPSSSLPCSERREAQTRLAHDDGHSLPGGMAIKVAADTFRRDSCSNTLATGTIVNCSGGVVGRPSHAFESAPGCCDGGVGTCDVEEEILPWHVSPLTSMVGFPMKCPEHEVTPIFEDQPLNWYPQPQAQATQHVLDEYVSAAGGVVRVEGDNQLRCRVASLLGPDWCVAEPSSTLAATPGGGGEADLWMPGAGSPSFTAWSQLGADCGTCVGAYSLPDDRVMAPGRGLALGLGDTRARFYGGTPQGSSWWLSPADQDCRDAEDGSDWQYRVGCCPTSSTRLSTATALPGSRGISTAAPPLAGLLSSHAVPRKSPTTPAFPWMAADEGESRAGVSERGGDGDCIFSERALSPRLPHYSSGRAMGSSCGHGDQDGGGHPLYSAQMPPPRSHHGSYAPQPPGHFPPFFGLPASSSVASASSNTIAAAAPAPHRVGRATRQHRRRSNGARPPRALNGTTERCRRFWERCRQSNVPDW